MTTEKKTGQELYQNFSRGLIEADMPYWMGPVQRGKVRDNWVAELKGERYRVQVTTDRLSAYDSVVCAIPDKGKVLNMLSSFWFDGTADIIPNHKIHVPHPNVLIAEQAAATLPVEVVVRRFMARSSSSTSVYRNYHDLGRREIYGIEFPDGLQANQEFPMGPIVTPTTKAEQGHDLELTDEEAREHVDSRFGDGTWDRVKEVSLALFERGYERSLSGGLMMVDTKYEFGIKDDGSLILIDELHTPDSSRFWLAQSYKEKFEKGENPESFDKEIVRRWLADHGFTGDGPVPEIPPEVIDQVSEAYTIPYKMITGKDLPGNPSRAAPIKDYTSRYFESLLT